MVMEQNKGVLKNHTFLTLYWKAATGQRLNLSAVCCSLYLPLLVGLFRVTRPSICSNRNNWYLCVPAGGVGPLYTETKKCDYSTCEHEDNIVVTYGGQGPYIGQVHSPGSFCKSISIKLLLLEHINCKYRVPTPC